MNNKEAIQKEIDALKQQEDDLTKRLRDLQSDLDKTALSIDGWTKVRDQAVLDKTDGTKAAGELKNAKERLEGLLGAISQANDRIDGVKYRRFAAEKECAKIDFNRLVGELDLLIGSLIERIDNAAGDFETIDAKFHELNRATGGAWRYLDERDHVRVVDMFYKGLSRSFQGGGGVIHKIKNFKRDFPDVLEELLADPQAQNGRQ